MPAGRQANRVAIVPLQSWYCDMVEKGGMPSTDLAPLQVNILAAICILLM